MKAILVSKDSLAVMQVKEILAEMDFSRFERAESEDACVTLVGGMLPDLVVIDADSNELRISWLADLCRDRNVAVLLLTSDRFAGSPDPRILVLRKPFMKAQLRLAIGEAIARRESGDDRGGRGASPVLRRD